LYKRPDHVQKSSHAQHQKRKYETDQIAAKKEREYVSKGAPVQ